MPHNLRYYALVIVFELDIWEILWSQAFAFFFFLNFFVQWTFNKQFLSSFYLLNTAVGARNSKGESRVFLLT